MPNICAFQESHSIKTRMSVYVKSKVEKTRLQQFPKNTDVRLSTDVFGQGVPISERPLIIIIRKRRRKRGRLPAEVKMRGSREKCPMVDSRRNSDASDFFSRTNNLQRCTRNCERLPRKLTKNLWRKLFAQCVSLGFEW